MFDFAWSEIALIAAVALILIGPKDMPVAIRAITGWIKKARRMAAEFQTHVDEMVREADLSEVRSSINEIRNFDIKGELEKAVDADGSIRSTFASDPLAPATGATTATSVEEIAVADKLATPEPVEEAPATLAAELPSEPLAPVFVPPNFVRAVAASPGQEPPVFIPPDVARQHGAQRSA